jgi:regulator of sirC expression with transglutaminase-like and TPR domain
MNTLEKQKQENPEFQSLIKLIDDENDFIYQNVKDKFLSYGKEAMHFLKDFFNSDNITIAERAKEIYELINFKFLDKKLRDLSYKESFLEEAAFAIASYEYPETDYDNYKMILDKMAIDLKEQIDKKYTDFVTVYDKVKMLNDYFFHEKVFKGNTKDYYEPDNSYLNRVIDRRTGIPITLSIVYMLIAGRIGIQFHGVNIPNHFIIKYKDDIDEFFIDVFNFGVIISKFEALNFLRQFGIYEKDFDNLPFLQNADDKDIIYRIFANLISVYEKEPNEKKVEQLTKLQSYFG